MKTLLFTYLLLMNLTGFICIGIDKQKAIKHQWRIPEKTLFLIAFFGGSIGTVLAAHYFHHKTKAKPLSFLLPSCLVFHIILTTFLFIQYYT